MSSKLPIPPPGFDELSPDEQTDYVQELYDYVDSHPQRVSIPDWHLELIEERMARYRENGMEGTTLEEFEKELLEQLLKG